MTGKDYNSKKIVKLREKRGWTQTEVATRINRNLRTVQRIEAGEIASYDAIKSIASLYDMPVTAFLFSKPQNFLPSKTTSKGVLAT